MFLQKKTTKLHLHYFYLLLTVKVTAKLKKKLNWKFRKYTNFKINQFYLQNRKLFFFSQKQLNVIIL